MVAKISLKENSEKLRVNQLKIHNFHVVFPGMFLIDRDGWWAEILCTKTVSHRLQLTFNNWQQKIVCTFSSRNKPFQMVHWTILNLNMKTAHCYILEFFCNDAC